MGSTLKLIEYITRRENIASNYPEACIVSGVARDVYFWVYDESYEQVSDSMQGETIKLVIAMGRSREIQMAICGSLVIEENENYYNRFVFVEPSGQIFLALR